MNAIKILHLEDSPLDADLAVKRLHKSGIACDITRVETRNDFLDALNARSFDLILSDFALPDFDGATALKLARETCPDTPFLFVSGVLGEEVAVDMLQRGATDYVLKQRLHRLSAAVERAISEAREKKELQKAREALEHQSHLTRLITDNATACLFLVDEEGRCTYMNQAAEQVTGWKFAEVENHVFHEVLHHSFYDGTPYPLSECPLFTALQKQVALREHEEMLIRKDGTFFPAMCSVSPIIIEGISVGTLIEARDITMEKEAEEELRRRQAFIEALNERLRLSMVETHHRVKNNLQIISAMIELYASNAGERPLSAEGIRLSGQVKTLAAVHDLLTQQAKEDGFAHTLHVKQLLEQLVSILTQSLGAHQIILKVQDDVALVTRQGTALALATNELVSNALKHAPGNVHIMFSVENGCALLIVRDHGDGFPENFDAHDAALTGLELLDFLVHWDLHGDITYKNVPDGGGVVTIEFPLTP